MSALPTISRVLVFLLLILQSFAGSIKGIIYYALQPTSPVTHGLSIEEEFTSKLSSLATLQTPNALLSPIPSFQFSFTEVLYCFLFVVLSFFADANLQGGTSFFTRSYFRTLFSSLILINAP